MKNMNFAARLWAAIPAEERKIEDLNMKILNFATRLWSALTAEERNIYSYHGTRDFADKVVSMYLDIHKYEAKEDDRVGFISLISENLDYSDCDSPLKKLLNPMDFYR